MKESKGLLFILDDCSNVTRWDPIAGSVTFLELEPQLDDASDFAVGLDQIAILGNDRSTIRVYDSSGSLLAEHRYEGNSFLTRIALVEGSVVAATYFDEHLLAMFKEGADGPSYLIRNPRYWPELSPRYSSFVEVFAQQGEYYAFDLVDFSLYRINPKTSAVETFQKEKHPWFQEPPKPTKPWGGEGSYYTGTMLAVTAALHDDALYVLMLDRSLVQGSAKPGDGYLELARTDLVGSSWRTLVRLEDPQRHGGSLGLSIIGNEAYLFKPDGSFYAVQISE